MVFQILLLRLIEFQPSHGRPTYRTYYPQQNPFQCLILHHSIFTLVDKLQIRLFISIVSTLPFLDMPKSDSIFPGPVGIIGQKISEVCIVLELRGNYFAYRSVLFLNFDSLTFEQGIVQGLSYILFHPIHETYVKLVLCLLDYVE